MHPVEEIRSRAANSPQCQRKKKVNYRRGAGQRRLFLPVFSNPGYQHQLTMSHWFWADRQTCQQYSMQTVIKEKRRCLHSKPWARFKAKAECQPVWKDHFVIGDCFVTNWTCVILINPSKSGNKLFLSLVCSFLQWKEKSAFDTLLVTALVCF